MKKKIETLTFTLKRDEIPVILTDEKGTKSTYTLRELLGTDRENYMDTMAQKMKFGPDGKPQGVKEYKGIQGFLISLCLFDSAGVSVPSSTILAWPSRVVEALFKACNELNAMTEESIEEVGNA